MKKIFYLVMLLLILVFVGATAVLSYFRLEGTPPTIIVDNPPKVLGRIYNLKFKVKDDRSGVHEVKVIITQGNKSHTVFDKSFPVEKWWEGTGIKEKDFEVLINPLNYGFSQGKIEISIIANDASWRGMLKGNKVKWAENTNLDTTPPIISVRSLRHNMMQGGSGLIVYRVNEPVSKTGVYINDHFFPACPKPGGPKGDYVAMMAIPYNVSSPKRMVIVAIDLAGNKAEAGFPYNVYPHKPKPDKIILTDHFLEQKVPTIMSRYPDIVKPGTLIYEFLEINHAVRKINNDQFRKICSHVTDKIYWHGSFIRLPHAALRAHFADHRYYYYHHKLVDKGYHMGVDLASIRHAPVPAANAGKVVFTGYLGIYGNTIIIDHGLGLYSTYSHLDSFKVAVGEIVKKGQIIGITDTTGLAGGDHLHFGMLVDGVFVNPVEWWDPMWVKTHILANLQAQ